MFRKLRNMGYNSTQLKKDFEELSPIPVSKQRERQAKKSSLDERVKNKTNQILNQRNVLFDGHQLDKKRLGKTNFVVLKSAIDLEINKFVGKNQGERHEFSLEELNVIDANFDEIITKATNDVFDGEN